VDIREGASEQYLQPGDSMQGEEEVGIVAMLNTMAYEIQDVVEKVLIETGHARTAKAYILYRQTRAKSRQELKVRKRSRQDSNSTDISLLVTPLTKDEILSFNEIPEGHILAVGDRIIVPDGKVKKTYSSSSSAKVVRGGSSPSYNGYYLSPISGYKKSQGLHGYNAVDLAAPVGTPIFASANGEVIISRTGWNGGYGNYIVISHANGTQTVYAHNSSNIVYSGQTVVAGQVIGYVGNTGRSTGPHVHFEVRGAQNPF